MARRKKEDCTMSEENAQQATAPTNVFKAKVTLFDLDKFEKVSKETNYTFDPVTDIQQALERANGDQEKLLKILNVGLKRQALSDAKHSISADGNLVSRKVVSGFVNQFKPMYPIGDPKDPAQKKEQLQKVYAFIRGNEGLMSAIKQLAVTMAEAGEDDDDENDED